MSIANTLPIEVAVMNAYAMVENDATKTLRDKIEQVDANMKEKDKLRKAQSALAQLKMGIDQGNQSLIDTAKGNIRSALLEAGIPTNSKAYKMAEWGWGTHSNNEFRQPSYAHSGMSDEVRDKLDSWYEALKTEIDGEAQARSDIGQKLQFELNEANNIYTRMTKARSDMSSKYDQSLKGIAQNIKG